MKPKILAAALFAGTALTGLSPAFGGQVPYSASAPNIPISSHDRVYTGDQFSNTVSVIDPADNKTLGVISLGAPSPTNFSPLYKGQVLVHGMGFSPDHRTIGVVSIGSNSVSFIDTATNTVKHVTYVGRAPHEAFWTPDGKEVWVTVRGENYVDIPDGKTFQEKTRIITPPGPGMTIFSPNGKYGYVCSSFNPETDVISVASHKIVGKVKQVSPFCPNIAATPDGKQVWITLKDFGKTQVFNANPPFNTLKILDTGPITNHVNIVENANGSFAYITIGGLNEVKVFRTDDFSQVATIPVGELPTASGLQGTAPELCRPRERRCGHRDRHADQQSGRYDGDRASATGVDLRTGRRADRRWHAEPCASGCRRPGHSPHDGGDRYREGRGAHDRDPVQPGPHSGAGGGGDGAFAEAALL